METLSSQSPQQQAQSQSSQQPQQQSTSTKNLKNWFDEFKARVSKKNQSNQANEQISADETKSPKDTANVTTPPPIASPIVSATTKVKSSNLRARKITKIPTTDSPNFDTASISTIFNRRDSRNEAVNARKRRGRPLYSKILAILASIISYLIPFNYSLPWKLLCLINSSFVIIVIGLVNGSSQTSTAFTFVNGFVCGLAVAIVCFVILTLSFMVQILPKSRNIGSSMSEKELLIPSVARNNNDSLIKNTTSVSFSIDSKQDASIDLMGRRSEDFSLFEILDEDNRPTMGASATDQDPTETKLDDDDYKGWMIEFIGDYEQRNTSDIKLKSIYVRIENRILYLCKPKNSHDADSTAIPVFANQRVYDLNNVRKFSANLLLPKTVRNRQKYVWSKKYPIRLEFLEENNDTTKISDGSKVVQLTFFAKSCREKEEWFRRFKRIVEENRLALGQSNKRSSFKCEEPTGNESINDSFFGSLKRFRRRSPSLKASDCVLTSQSSHILGVPKRLADDDEKQKLAPETGSSSSSLTRTKSCELLHTEQGTSDSSNNEQKRSSEGGPHYEAEPEDDSTLTRETAELFSQAVEYSNFIESQPTLNYREYIERVIESGQEATSTSDWFNALIGRIFYDVFSHNYWSVWFKRKIQRKLYRIRLPYFMETLTLTKIDLGTNAPQFFNVVSHNFNSYGLSIDFDMAYSGGLTMTFETKLNLLKIKSDNSGNPNTSSNSANINLNPNTSNNSGNSNPLLNQQPGDTLAKDSSSTASESSLPDNTLKDCHKPPPLSSSGSTRTSGESSNSDNSDSDSSSDSSFDEADANEISDWEDYGAEKTRQNIVRFVDKIASSRYFQHATENRYIKKKLQDISNCPLVLVVQIQSLNGVLTLNVPPPQTDRIWYGFKPMPELTLKALPKMGDREVNLSHVTDWIERKLAEEFRKILVIPNMEDIVLPVLKSDHLQYVTATR